MTTMQLIAPAGQTCCSLMHKIQSRFHWHDVSALEYMLFVQKILPTVQFWKKALYTAWLDFSVNVIALWARAEEAKEIYNFL